MAKVITLSRTFPKGHPREGEPTYFVEAVLRSFSTPTFKLYSRLYSLNPYVPIIALSDFDRSILDGVTSVKHHTIRSGKRFKTGDRVSLRVWGDDINPKSGRKGPYHSKQIAIAPDVEVTVYDLRFHGLTWGMLNAELNGRYYFSPEKELFPVLAENDGLSLEDFKGWFAPYLPGAFEGQIICWSDAVSYGFR